MKKLLLCSILSILFANAYSQDTTCTYFNYFNNKRVIEFDYKTSEILKDTLQENKGFYEIHVEYGNVLCLHFDDQKKRFRKVVTEFFDGAKMEEILDSKDHVYFSPKGAEKVFVGRPTIFKI